MTFKNGLDIARHFIDIKQFVMESNKTIFNKLLQRKNDNQMYKNPVKWCTDGQNQPKPHFACLSSFSSILSNLRHKGGNIE